MSYQTFKARIEINGVNPYVLVTAKRAQALKPDWKKPIPVLVQINGKPDDPWHINMVPMGNGDYYLYLHGDVRKASNTKVGDDVTVTVCFDEEYKNGPMQPMPDWFQSALQDNKKALTSWESLSPSRKKEIVRYLTALKTEEAKKRNVERVMYVLAGNTDRFMGRTWKDGK